MTPPGGGSLRIVPVEELDAQTPTTDGVALSSVGGRLLRSDVVRHGFVVFAAMLTANVVTYVYYAGTARTLGVVSAGALNSLLSAILFFTVPTNAGGIVIAAITAEARARRDAARVAQITRRVSLWGVAFGVVLLASVAAAAGPISTYLHLDAFRTIAIAGIALAFSVVLPLQRGILQGAGSFNRYATSNVVEAVPKALLGIVLSLTSLRLDGALAGLCAAVGLAYGYNSWAISGAAAESGGDIPRTTGAPFRALLVITPVAALNFMTFYDVIVVRHSFVGREAGLYAAAALVGRALLTVIAFVPAVILPKAAERIARDHRAALRLLFMALAASGAIVAGGVAACDVFPERVAVLIAGPAFVAAAPLVLPYALAMAALAEATVLASFLIGAGLLGFAAPLALVAAAEIGTVVFFHPSIGSVLRAVEIGHALALGVTVVAVVGWARKKNYRARGMAGDNVD